MNSMNDAPATRKLLTLVCEATLEPLLIHDLPALGAHGYTITDARGRGEHGKRDGAWPAAANIRIEVICEETTARAIVAFVQERYYANYGMVAWLADVEVLRPAKF
jgi:hypothetical protein